MAKLIKIESKHNNLRTDTVEGKILQAPKLGESFIMTGKSLTEGVNTRYIETSIIQKIVEKDNVILFNTEFSTYKLIV